MLYDLENISHHQLSNRQGVSYLEFRKRLHTRYWKVYLDIFLGYAGLSLTLYFLFLSQKLHLYFSIPAALLGAIFIGYGMAYLQLFIHEGAHFNNAPSRRMNEILTNLLIGAWAGQSVQAYRQIHWEHHRHLGQTNDSEHSYFEPLDARSLLKFLFFAQVIQILASRNKRLVTLPAGKPQRKFFRGLFFILGISLNLTLIYSFVRSGFPLAAWAWVLGMGAFFPFFGAIRQLLEHRSNQADNRNNYRETPHGRFTRMFREGPIGSTLGGAGFSRHLLHHWDPQVSYTCLSQVEKFFRETDLAEPLEKAKTTYWSAFRELWNLGEAEIS